MPTAVSMHPASYRDPSGFIFEKDGVLYRQVNKTFKEDYDFFISSGCYQHLVDRKLLISHQTIQDNLTGSQDHYFTLLPEKIAFISYSYEWSTEMLRDAALLTLQLVKESISFGLLLKDATPYNIQWHKGKLIFIDTLSFEKYNAKEPWVAYRQFCESFLGPLLTMHYSKMPLHQLQLAYPDGIPIQIIKRLLPGISKLSLYTYLHIHLHAGITSKKKSGTTTGKEFSKQKLLNLINSLESLIKKLRFPYKRSAWSEYYDEASQRDDYLPQKKQIISEWLDELTEVKNVIDLGANDGEFSELTASKNVNSVAVDSDPWCINNLYKKIKASGIVNIQPMIIDLANPSAATGVNNVERDSFIHRCKADLVLALALIHHLAIGKNIPLEKISDFFSRITSYLIIEFVPKEDEKVKLILENKKDIYDNYSEAAFEKEFKNYFEIKRKKTIGNSNRILYLMKRVK